MTGNNEILKRLRTIEDELIRLRKQRNYELNNLDEDNVPRLREYSKLISENQKAVSLVEQQVTDVSSSVTILSEYVDESIIELQELTGNIDNELTTVKSNVADIQVQADANEAAISLNAQSITEIDKSIDALNQTSTDLRESIANVELKADENSADITLLTQSVSRNTSEISGLQETIGNIDNELTTVKTNLASVETKADDAAASAELAAQSVTELENEVNGKFTTVNSNIASVKTTADSASASVSAIVSNIGANGSVTAASIVAKINAAGSAVQISADHISLAGKTIALTADDIDIASTYFNVATSGAVECTSLSVTGSKSSIDVTGSSSDSGLITARYASDGSYYSAHTPTGLNAYYPYGYALYTGSFIDLLSRAYTYSRYSQLAANQFYVQTNGQSYPAFRIITNDPPWVESVIVGGQFTAYGLKSRIERTEHYGDRLMYAFETPNPFYSDIGRGTVGDDGLCYVDIDPIFYECIDNTYDYLVFLQLENSGELIVTERNTSYFVVSGTPGAQFAWMMIAPQKGYSATREEEFYTPEIEPTNEINQDDLAADEMNDDVLNEFENQLY